MSRYKLATAMAQQRQRLGLSVVECVEMSDGLARSTWRELESASRVRITAPVAFKVDQVLNWEPGTAAGLFNEPSPMASDPIFESPEGHPPTEAVSQAQLAAVITALRTEIDRRLPTTVLEDAIDPAWHEWLAIGRQLSPERRAHWLAMMRADHAISSS